jgi:hypothetical protein
LRRFEVREKENGALWIAALPADSSKRDMRLADSALGSKG